MQGHLERCYPTLNADCRKCDDILAGISIAGFETRRSDNRPCVGGEAGNRLKPEAYIYKFLLQLRS